MSMRHTVAGALILLSSLAVDAGAAKKTRVTLFVLPDKTVGEGAVSKVSRHLYRALAKDPRLAVKDWNSLLLEFSGQIPEAELNRAAELHRIGLRLLEEQKPQEAREPLAAAFDQLVEVLPFARKQQLADIQLALAVALARGGSRRRAVRVMEALLVWRPQMRYQVERFGGGLLPLFERAREEVGERPRGSVELDTVPPKTRAYVDGQFVGVTPTVAIGLTVGEHYATFRRPGYVKAGQAVKVSPRLQRSYRIELRQNEKYLLLRQTLQRARNDLGKPRTSDAVLDLRTLLAVEQVIFARLSQQTKAKYRVDAYLYDLRSKLRLEQISITVPAEDLSSTRQLATLLYADAPYDGRLAAPPPPPQPSAAPERQSPKRFYERWWFWTAVGAGVTAAVLTAVFWPQDGSCSASAPAGTRCAIFRN